MRRRIGARRETVSSQPIRGTRTKRLRRGLGQYCHELADTAGDQVNRNDTGPPGHRMAPRHAPQLQRWCKPYGITVIFALMPMLAAGAVKVTTASPTASAWKVFDEGGTRLTTPLDGFIDVAINDARY